MNEKEKKVKVTIYGKEGFIKRIFDSIDEMRNIFFSKIDISKEEFLRLYSDTFDIKNDITMATEKSYQPKPYHLDTKYNLKENNKEYTIVFIEQDKKTAVLKTKIVFQFFYESILISIGDNVNCKMYTFSCSIPSFDKNYFYDEIQYCIEILLADYVADYIMIY